MKVIIIAAGSSTRLAKETSDIPKGLLKINDKSIIEIQLELFQKNQLSDITIIIGPNRHKFELKNVDYIQDDEFQNHDVLGSLMAAKPIMNNEILISYSDIIFDKNDNVHSPAHYLKGKKETIDVIQDGMTDDEYHGYLKGNVLKYVSRYKFKGEPLEDLEKAQWYLNRLIKEVK